MKNIRKKFENETKTRINIISFDSYVKTNLQGILVKQGIFNKKDFLISKSFDCFPTEILCSSTKCNIVNVYLSIKKKEELCREVKEIILKSIYEASLIVENKNLSKNIEYNEEKEVESFKQSYISILNQFFELFLNKFYEVDNIEMLFESIKYNELLNEIKKINYNNNQESVEDKDDIIWKNFFGEFQIQFQKQYDNWEKMISIYYIDDDEGYEYINEEQDYTNSYSNKDFDSLCKILYGIKSSCALMIERAYIEAPSSKIQFSGNVYIFNTKDTKYKKIHQIIEKRISEDYKEVFLILANCGDDISYFSMFKEKINKITLDRRIFCILNEFDFYRGQLLIEKNDMNSFVIEGNLVDSIKLNISEKMGISYEKIIVTEQFNDIDKKELKALDTKSDITNLLKLIKVESESICRVIKIKPTNKEKIINISLNQERMSVQALMVMLYDRYNGYLVDLWSRIIEEEERRKYRKRYYYSTIRTILRNRKDNYKEYKHVSYEDINKSYKNIIDFSLRSGDCNDSKKILKMLVNYGYNTVGFNCNENKILVTVNGEISQEDKDNLIKSIEGRLEESAVNYFESAFLMEVSQNKFNANSLYKALECEKNITIDDFYSAFREIFRKMSDNIMRYEVYLK